MQVNFDSTRSRHSRNRGAHLGAAALILALIATAAVSERANAQASLAEDDRDDITVQASGQAETFTVLRDARRPNQWYYVVDVPRLYVRQDNGRSVPEFSLLRYEITDPDHPDAPVQAGLLQFSATLAIPPDALTALKAGLAQKRGLDAAGLQLSALPIKSADVTLYLIDSATNTGKLVASTYQGAGMAPTFASEKMAFSIPLTANGADVYDAVINSPTGIGVAVKLNYEGLTPPVGVKVTVNWDQAFHHYDSDQKFAAQASYFGLFGASFDGEWKNIYDNLTQHGDIKVDPILGNSFTQADAERVLQPVLKRMNDELVQGLAPPDKVDVSTAANPGAHGFFGSAGYSVSTKTVDQIRHGSDTFTYNQREYQDRSTIASGYIGINGYSQQLKDQMVTIMPAGPWKVAYFVLPHVGNGAALGIDEIDMEVAVRNTAQELDRQLVTWTPTDANWKDKNGSIRTDLAFGLTSETVHDPNLSSIRFQSKYTITSGNQVLVINQDMGGFTRQEKIVTPLSSIDVVTVDPQDLSWHAIQGISNLQRVDVKLQSSGASRSFTIRPPIVNGQPQVPQPVYWFVEHAEPNPNPVMASAAFTMVGGSTVPWKDNGVDLRSRVSDLHWNLEDSDWVPH